LQLYFGQRRHLKPGQALRDAQISGYRLRDRFYIVDRIFDAAELRLGLKKQQIVHIDRVSRPAKRRAA